MIIVGRTGLVVERFRALRLMTVPEYFERKYSRGLRLLAGILVATGGILNMGVFLKIEGRILDDVSGIDSRYLVAVMTAILLLELVYTVLGGMVSVVITDFMQYILLSIATILVSIYAVDHAGSEQDRRQGRAAMGRRFRALTAPASADVPHLAGPALVSLSTCWQTTAMRMFSTNSPATAKKVMTWTGSSSSAEACFRCCGAVRAAHVRHGRARRTGSRCRSSMGRTGRADCRHAGHARENPRPGRQGESSSRACSRRRCRSTARICSGWRAVISQDIVVPVARSDG